MFRIDKEYIVDATFFGNEARMLNHSCNPNCGSKIFLIDGKKKIIIYSLREIIRGEELTYDY